MFTKIAIATVVVIATASGALAQTKRMHSTNPAHDVYVGGEYVGSDPDSFIRGQLLRDNGNE